MAKTKKTAEQAEHEGLAEIANGNNGQSEQGQTIKRTKCPITKAQFLSAAKPMVLEFGGQRLVLTPRSFSTGSFGWHANDKVVMDIGGVPTKCQPNFSLIVVGSKEVK